MNKTVRNLIIFAVATAGGGFVGIGLDRLHPPQDPMQGLGALVWLITPLATGLLLRTFGGDGWKDFGLAPKLRLSWVWYLAAVLIVPLISGLTLGLGVGLGAISLSVSAAQGANALVSLAGVASASVLVKNVFEEFAWRGYLTPRFASLKLNPFIGYVLTGFIWASWHVAYYLYFLPRQVLQSQTSLSPSSMILIAFVLLPLQAITFGELRLLSRSVWPAWLMHVVANLLTFSALGLVTLHGAWGTVLSPGTEGVVFSILFGLVGLGLYRMRTRRAGVPTPAGAAAANSVLATPASAGAQR